MTLDTPCYCGHPIFEHLADPGPDGFASPQERHAWLRRVRLGCDLCHCREQHKP